MTQVAYVLIITKYGKEKDVAQKLMKYKEVENVHILYGQYDVIAKLKAANMPQIEDFIFRKIRSNKDIENTETLIASDVA